MRAWQDGDEIYVQRDGGPICHQYAETPIALPASAVELVPAPSVAEENDAADDARELLESLGKRVLDREQCCELACNGGGCETCPCCCAGWCVWGHDGLPEDVDDRAHWIEVAREHNPIVAALAEALARTAGGAQ